MPDSASRDKPSRADIEEMRWYHTIELPGGIVTPGEYDLRPIIENLPIPASLEGMRCIDVGSRDGFYAFEMEKRGSADVLSIDVDDPDEIAMPATATADRGAVAEELRLGNRAFEVAREALGSEVRREMVSAYELDPELQGQFEFGVIGSLLLHLRDPVGALTAIRRVVSGRLLINDAVAVNLDVVRRRAVAELYMQGAPFWWLCNPAGLRRMAEAAGFRVLDSGRPYLIPYGEGPRTYVPGLRGPLTRLPRRVIQRRGSMHAWVLAEAS